MRISRWGGAAALGLAVGLAVAAPAAADHNTVAWERTGGECGETTFTSSWTAADHQVGNTVLVVQAAGEQHVAQVGESITVGPFEAAEVTIRWRVWGGGERAGDDPQLNNLDALLAYLEANPGGELDADPPGVAWRNRTVKGCVPEPSPSPSSEPTTAPTVEPTKPADPQPTDPQPTDPAAPGQGGGGDKPGLPVTGVSMPVVAGIGVALLAGGSGLWWLARRRGVTFSA